MRNLLEKAKLFRVKMLSLCVLAHLFIAVALHCLSMDVGGSQKSLKTTGLCDL